MFDGLSLFLEYGCNKKLQQFYNILKLVFHIVKKKKLGIMVGLCVS